jgi:hypothetical protein
MDQLGEEKEEFQGDWTLPLRLVMPRSEDAAQGL